MSRRRVPSDRSAATNSNAGGSDALTPTLAIDVCVYDLLDEVYASSVYYDEQWILDCPCAFDIAVRAWF